MNFDFFGLESSGANPAVPTAEDIYAAYPRKQHRLYAIQCIKKAMQREHPSHLLERTQAYAAAVALWSEKDRKQYTPHASSWFNKGGYADDPAVWDKKGSTKGKAGFA